jgi:hypothetical protein
MQQIIINKNQKKIPPTSSILIVAQALFRSIDLKMAGWKTGSRITVGLKIAKC